MKIRIFSILLAIVVAVAMGLVACAPAAEEEEEEEEEEILEFKFGMNVPLSGGAAEWGFNSVHGAEFERQKVEERGYMDVGGKLYKLVVIPYDSKYDAAEALGNCRRHTFEDLIKYQWILGGGVVPSCQPVTEAEGVMCFACAYGGTTVTNPDNPLTFRVIIGTDLAFPVAFPYLAEEHPEISKVALVAPNDDVGRTGGLDVNNWAPTVGWEVVAEEYTERTLVDYLPVLTRILAADPDLIVPTNAPLDMKGLTIKAARELGYEGYFFVDTPTDIGGLMEIAGAEYCENTYFVNCITELFSPAIEDLDARSWRTYGEGLLFGAIEYHASVQAITQAIEIAGTFDTTAVADALATGTFDTVYGPVTFGGEPMYGIDRQVLHPVPIGVIENGAYVHIELMEIPEELR